MKNIKLNLFFGLSLILFSCSEKSETTKKEKETNVSENKIESDDSTNYNFTIYPGKSFGDILPNSSEKDLIKLFGQENVIRDSIHVGEGYYEIGTTVFKNTPNEITIMWNDTTNFRNPTYIKVRAAHSNWKTFQGIQIGTNLKQLEVINGGSFTMTGFAWDYAGTIIDWKNGNLADIAGESNDHMLIRLGEYENLKITQKEYEQLIGDQAFESSNKLLQKMNPIVYEMVFGFIQY